MKPTHYDKRMTSLYGAVVEVLAHHGRVTDGRSVRDLGEALDTLEHFRAWLATTDAGHGLTSEPTSAFRARQEAGVSARLEGASVVIRVRRP